jgi:thiol:disulfide interchange protein DsbD
MKRYVVAALAVLLAGLGLFAPSARAVDESDLLPVDQAFALSAKAVSRQRIEFTWAIAPGYYLYRERIKIQPVDSAFKFNPLQLPEGHKKHDEFFGDVQTYRDSVTAVQTGASASDVDAVTFSVRYQGCADLGICYPPQTRKLTVALPVRTGVSDSVGAASAAIDASESIAAKAAPTSADPLAMLAGKGPSNLLGNDKLPLPEDQAFKFDAIVNTPDELLVRFTPAPGYYLYRDKSSFAVDGVNVVLGDPRWPAGKQHSDEYFKNVVVYFDQIDVPLPIFRLKDMPAETITLHASYQGCQTDGLCYPPIKRAVTLQLPAGKLHVGAALAATGSAESIAPEGVPTGNSFSALLLALLLALGGGVILNLMPCVLPVLSLKALSLSQGHETHAKVRLHALWYTAGVMLSFAAVGALAMTLRKAGLALGWGFQLQQPVVVAALALVMFAIGLSLSGVFQIGAGFAGIGQKLTEKSGPAGDFFTGVLAVVVASPCTTPLMGGALAYAFTAPPALAISVFLALGLGLALPFLLIAYVPALASRLPKPGAWMETLKQLLAFPMYATAAWLVSVLASQRGHDGVLYALFGATALALGLWWWERERYGTRKFARVLAMLIALASLWSLVEIQRLPPANKVASEDFGVVAYSPGKLAELRAQHRIVFIDMTADWCVSCKTNEKLVFSRPAFRASLDKVNAVYMVGDYTNVDDDITAFLAAHHWPGVPLYVVYPASGGEGEVLPTLLTQGIVDDALQRAAAR